MLFPDAVNSLDSALLNGMKTNEEWMGKDVEVAEA